MKNLLLILFKISLFFSQLIAANDSVGWACKKISSKEVKKVLKEKRKSYFDDYNRLCVELKKSDLKDLGITIKK